MPYVEGFGTWPFGEEWLFEAIASSYLPLLELLDAHEPAVTLSRSRLCCAISWGAPGLAERFHAFIEGTAPLPPTPRTPPGCAPVGIPAPRRRAGTGLERRLRASPRSAWPRVGETCCGRSRRMPAGRPRRPTPCCRCLPTDACAHLQVRAGIASHLDRFEGGGDLERDGSRDEDDRRGRGEPRAGPMSGREASGCLSAGTRLGWSRSSPPPACAPRAWS